MARRGLSRQPRRAATRARRVRCCRGCRCRGPRWWRCSGSRSEEGGRWRRTGGGAVAASRASRLWIERRSRSPHPRRPVARLPRPVRRTPSTPPTRKSSSRSAAWNPTSTLTRQHGGGARPPVGTPHPTPWADLLERRPTSLRVGRPRLFRFTLWRAARSAALEPPAALPFRLDGSRRAGPAKVPTSGRTDCASHAAEWGRIALRASWTRVASTRLGSGRGLTVTKC